MKKNVFEARIRLLLQQWPMAWGGNLSVQAICAYVLWSHHSHQTIILWCVINLLLFSYRLSMWRNYDNYARQGAKGIRRWARNYVISAVPGGLVWGSAAWLFFDPQQAQPTIFILVVMTGISAGALPSLSSYSPAYIAFASSILIPMAVKLSIMDWAYSGWLAILSLTFLGVTLVFSRNLEQTISKAITLDLHNQRLLKEVTHARDKEQQANTQKSRFLALVSHDLRQPLYAMSLFMESLKALVNTQEQQKVLQCASQSRDDLDDMFDALLEVSQLETGAIKPVFKHVELQPIIDSLLNNFSTHANNKQLTIENNHCDAIVQTDPVLLARILNNLLSNAIKYTDEGHISIICQKIDDQLEIKIRDTGCGISKDKQSIIFNEYQQLNNPERDKNKGLGLGLTVVNKISKLLKHQIKIHSTPGKGSEFSVLLPLGKIELVTKNKPLSTTQCFSNLHIMLIEDNQSVRESTSGLLKQWHYKVSAYASEEQAVADLRENPQRLPDMIICDYRLADNKNGTQAIATVRKLVDMKLPALIITADTDPETKTEISALGYFMIKKPVRPAYLKNIINEMLS